MFRHAALIGLGTMGPGIVARLARGGVSVTAFDTDSGAADRASAMVERADAVLDQLGIVAPESGAGRIEFIDSLEAAVQSADLILENVPEILEIKRDVYEKLDALIAPDVIVATDTSGIPISTLQQSISHPERFVGMHWSNPPHIVPMIEVIGGTQTSTDTVDILRQFIQSLGLLPIVVKKDIPGFVENRVLYALLREVVDLVEQGVIEPEDIDACVSWGIGFKTAVVGPMALLDMAGMDIYHSVSSFLNSELCRRQDVAPLVLEKISEAQLGMKTGQGIYDYTAESISELQVDRARKLVAIRRILEGND